MSGFHFSEAVNVRIASEDEVGTTTPPTKRRRVAGLESRREAFVSHGSWVQQDQSHTLGEIDDNDLVHFNGLEADFTARHILDGFDDGARLQKEPPCSEEALMSTHHGAGFLELNSYNVPFQEFFEDAATQQWLSQQFPSLLPSLPILEERDAELDVPNPFAPGGAAEHPRFNSSVVADGIPADGSVNGLIKFRMQPRKSLPLRNALNPDSRPRRFGPSPPALVSREQIRENVLERCIPYLPPDFGRDLRLDAGDANLLKFYLVAYCAGRTLLPKSNGYLCDIAPIAQKDQCVKHALLAMAASYVLDYSPSDSLRARANDHYKKAATLLSEALRDSKTYTIGQEESVLATLVLFSHDDLVNWELHHPRNNLPKWYRGARTAKLVLDRSDPGYRYQRPINVQSSHARHVLGNLIAMYDILCQVVCPLNLEEVKNQYPWLLEGNEREVRRIVGLTGMSPKLLHTIGQISHLAARLNHDPESTVVPIAGKIIEDRLTGFHQWSDLSEGHASTEALLASCVLDQDGKVSCAVAVNELTAESYVAMAQIYLQCRVFRKSRRHTDVQSSLRVLLQCISRLPTSGFLYTAQGAVLRTLVAGIVAVDPQHRGIIRGLFVKTVKGPRGSIPPCWRALQDIWLWQDTELNDSDVDEHTMLASRTSWWETMAERLHQKEGRLNVC